MVKSNKSRAYLELIPRKRGEVDPIYRIGKQPESDHDKLVNDCYSELIAVKSNKSRAYLDLIQAERGEVDPIYRIGKQPESDHDKLINDCYNELIAVAKDIGKVKQIKGLTRSDSRGEGGGRPYL